MWISNAPCVTFAVDALLQPLLPHCNPSGHILCLFLPSHFKWKNNLIRRIWCFSCRYCRFVLFVFWINILRIKIPDCILSCDVSGMVLSHCRHTPLRDFLLPRLSLIDLNFCLCCLFVLTENIFTKDHLVLCWCFLNASVDTLVMFCLAGEKQALRCTDKEAAMNEFRTYH